MIPLLLFPPVSLPWHFWPSLVSSYVLVPLLGITILIQIGVLKDFHVYERKKRNITYPIAIAGAIVSVLYLSSISIKQGYLDYSRPWSLSIVVALILLWLVNLCGLKASAHMTGTGGFLASVMVLWLWGWDSGSWILNAGVACVLVYTARRGLSAHSHFELLTGFGLGFITTFAILYL